MDKWDQHDIKTSNIPLRTVNSRLFSFASKIIIDCKAFLMATTTTIPYTQQEYYDQKYGTLLHSYCTCTYTKETVLLLWSISAVTT